MTSIRPFLLVSILLFAAPGLAHGRAHKTRAKRPPRPRLLLSLGPVQAADAALKADAAALQPLVLEAIRAEPLTLATLGLKNPTPARRRRALARRRLRAYTVTVRLVRLTNRVRPGTPRQLEGQAALEVTLVRQRRRAKPKTLTVQGAAAVPISVVLLGEVLAVRRAALRAAAQQAVQKVVHAILPRRR